ncbi:MAG: response regulator transcription factor [Saprospiraceae bacterium]|nr:response regulator transcription factor [Saprospiraceae bacterium]
MLRIALADDQELFMESLCALLAKAEEALEVIWTAKSGEEAIEKVHEAPPDVLVLDYFFKGKLLDGAETCRLLRETHPELGVLLLSVSCEMTVIRDALQKGARGYASKDISKAELLRGIEAIARGERFLDQTALAEVFQTIVAMPPALQAKPPKSLLTPRELDVASPYAKGKSVREMAESLFISEDTVESHIKNIRSKTGATSRYEVGEWMKKNELWTD